MVQTEAEVASEARRKHARDLFTKATDYENTPPASRAQFWGELWTFVKTTKKSWTVLGFTPAEVERAKTNKPDWV